MQQVLGLDVIGDVHGEIDALTQLLSEMGYSDRGGAWQHSRRQAVFVGDIIDRGPGQIEVVELVRNMCETGSAQMCLGNHEWNAMCWLTPDPNQPGKFLRDHDKPAKRSQHAAFLAAVVENSHRHREYVQWFSTLPLWLDLPGLRVVHACWQESRMATIRRVTGERCLPTHELLVAAGIAGSAEHEAVEITLKGIEAALPAGMTFFDKGGIERSETRIMWWREEPRTFRNSALVDGDEVREQLPENALPASTVIEPDGDPRPVVFGHYWATGTPRLQTDRAVCVDYSAALNGALVAYRWNGESELNAANLVAVTAGNCA